MVQDENHDLEKKLRQHVAKSARLDEYRQRAEQASESLKQSKSKYRILVDRLQALAEAHPGSAVAEDVQRLLARVGTSSDTVSAASGWKFGKRSHSRSGAERDDASPQLAKLKSERSLIDRSDDLRSAVDPRGTEELLAGDGILSLSDLGGAPRAGSGDKTGSSAMLPPRRSVDQGTANEEPRTAGLLDTKRDASPLLDKSVSTSDLKLDETLTPA